MLPRRRRALLLSALGFVLLAIGFGYFRLTREVKGAFAAAPSSQGTLQFHPVPPHPFPLERWGGGEVLAVAATPSSLLTAGGFGVADESGELSGGLPTLKAVALTLWRGHPVAALASGGLFLRREGRWEEARCTFPLEVRALLEVPGGDLWIGARQGLFLAPWAGGTVVRIDAEPVRALALGPGGLLLAGGESGLRRIDGRQARALPSPDPWIDWIGVQGGDTCVLTPLGLARGPLGGTLLPVPGGREVRSAAQAGNQIYATANGRVLRFDSAGRGAEEWLPAPPIRVLSTAGLVFADTVQGLFRKTPAGWSQVRSRPAALPPGPTHITALAAWNGRILAGLFDGGLLSAEDGGGRMDWKPVPEAPAWGVNAILPAEAAVYIAGLRGALRWDGRTAASLTASSAYAVARTAEGPAIGLGTGVLLPDGRMLSAFHGLPGNQALALAVGDELFVGTPSGLGAIAGGRVAWRVTAGEGKLPHPWVTALALQGSALYVGTYGGGLARRTPFADGRPGPGHFDPYPETGGLKVNPGCLLATDGAVYAGTEGRGLFRLRTGGTRFEPVPAALPSPRITALLQNGASLLVGTDEGLARLPLSQLREGP